MKTMNQIIGDNLKRIRELSGFTQEQTAKSVGIERSAYSNYEGGTREVPYDVLERISNIFGCEPFILFEDNIQADNEILAAAFRISDLANKIPIIINSTIICLVNTKIIALECKVGKRFCNWE